MKFSITKDELLTPLQQVVGVVERKQTKEVMSNLLIVATDDYIELTGTDNEVELRTRLPLIVTEPGKTTIPARKLFDLCRSLSDGAHIDFETSEQQIKIKSGRSRFTLATLPHEEFPVVDELIDAAVVSLPQVQLSKAIRYTSFAMAQQDVRYYLNGLLLELSSNQLCCVATDGHRLALHRTEVELKTEKDIKVIIPRKAINELGRLLDDSDHEIEVRMTANHMQLKIAGLRMTSKLIDGTFPNYDKVIPLGATNIAVVDRELFRQALSRGAILANETYKGVRLSLDTDVVGIQTNNPKHEAAEDELEIDYKGEKMEVGFNVTYILDVLGVLETDSAELHLQDNGSSLIIHPSGNQHSTYVVMPMRL